MAVPFTETAVAKPSWYNAAQNAGTSQNGLFNESGAFGQGSGNWIAGRNSDGTAQAPAANSGIPIMGGYKNMGSPKGISQGLYSEAQRVAEEQWRAQEQQVWWGRQALNEWLSGQERATGLQDQSYGMGLDYFNQALGDQNKLYDWMKGTAQNNLNPLIEWGDKWKQALAGETVDPESFRKYQVGALADTYQDDMALKRGLQRANQGGNLGPMAQAAALLANQESAIGRENMARGIQDRSWNEWRNWADQGTAARGDLANINQAIGVNQSNTMQNYNKTIGNLLMDRQSAQAQSAMDRSTQLANYYNMRGSNDRADFNDWKGYQRHIADWTANAQNNYNNLKMQIEAQKQNSLMNGAFGLAGNLLAPMTGGGSTVLGSLLGGFK